MKPYTPRPSTTAAPARPQPKYQALVSVALLPPTISLSAEALGLPPPRASASGPFSPHGPLPPLTAALLSPAAGVGTAVTTFLTAFLLSLLFRRPWLYWPAFVAVCTSITFAVLPQATAGAQAVSITFGVIYWALIAAFIYRFGWLGNLVASSCLV